MHQRSRRVFQLFVSVGLDNSLTCINFTFKNNLKRILHWALPEAKSSSIIANEIVWTGWPSQLFHVHNFRNIVASARPTDLSASLLNYQLACELALSAGLLAQDRLESRRLILDKFYWVKWLIFSASDAHASVFVHKRSGNEINPPWGTMRVP